MNGNTLERFGFSSDKGGPHLARTMMLGELDLLLENGRIGESRRELFDAIEHGNVLGKRSAQSRRLTARHLSKLYALDHAVPLYHAFTFLWEREAAGRPLLALLVAYVRDAVLKASAPFIFQLHEGERFDRGQLESFIDALQPGRFSTATLRSAAQNIAGSWTQSGHLRGRVKKVRRFVDPTPASVALALLLSHISGHRGQLLFETEYVKLLDCQPSRGMELAETAASKGWINFRRIGSVMEVSFPRLLTDPQMEVSREQD